MEAKEVISKILSEANAKADEIIAKGGEEVAEFNKQTDEQLGDFQERSRQMADTQAEDKKQRLLASSRMQSRKQILAAKQEVLSNIYASAKRHLLEMDGDSYRQLFKRLIISSVESGDEVVMTGRKEDVLDASFVEQINAEKKDAGWKLELSKDKGDFDKGVLLVRDKVRVNISVDVLLQMAKDSLETEIAAELFPR